MLLHLGPDYLVGVIHELVLLGKSLSKEPYVGRYPALWEHVSILAVFPVLSYLIIYQSKTCLYTFNRVCCQKILYYSES